MNVAATGRTVWPASEGEMEVERLAAEGEDCAAAARKRREIFGLGEERGPFRASRMRCRRPRASYLPGLMWVAEDEPASGVRLRGRGG
ncbi:hypothetical protein GWI33_010184 [Rhynchophorus ferrugineus]|uniref:Uncharacterized protein n=1 Tax=Rhynchophorus ferrugineus TaxID=354439 RepID=A0A834MNI5_RHYFE|nr:hypothetical protein GWI33_010184 [Rhynchophorus ferrugineus]